MRTMLWSGGQLDISWYYVTDDRIVVDPVNGADPVDLAIELERNAANVATYRDEGGGTWQVDWGDGRSQTVNVERDGSTLTAFDGGLMSEVKPFERSSFEDQTYSGLASVGQVTRHVTLAFVKDGRFRMSSLGAVTGGPGTTGVGVSESESQGTVEVEPNTIHLRFDDGTEWHLVGQPYDLGQGEIILGDQLFKKAG